VANETKLAITNCASRGFASSKTFGAVGHCSLLFGVVVAVRRLSFHCRTSPVRALFQRHGA
jgi:hypothetical protein